MPRKRRGISPDDRIKQVLKGKDIDFDAEPSGTLVATPGQFCPRAGTDHAWVCMQPNNTSCWECPEYLDGKCGAMPYPKEISTENMKELQKAYEHRELKFSEIGIIQDEIAPILRKVRKEQGR